MFLREGWSDGLQYLDGGRLTDDEKGYPEIGGYFWF